MLTKPLRIDAGRHGIYLRLGSALDPLGGELKAQVFNLRDARLLAQAPAMCSALLQLLDLHAAHHNHPLHAAVREVLREVV